MNGHTYESWNLNYVSPEAEQGRARGGSLLLGATRIAAASQSAGAKDKIREPLNRKERARFSELIRPLEEAVLRSFALETDYYISEEAFSTAFTERKIAEGAEQQVYHSYDGVHVLKTNDAIMHGSWLEFFNRLAVHNWLFPEVAYLLTGFTQVKGRFAAIVQQPFLQSDRGATRNEIEPDLAARGFRRTRNDDYYSAGLGIILEDLHDENVLVTENGHYLYFDPVVYLETPKMALDGNRVYHFPFNQ